MTVGIACRSKTHLVSFVDLQIQYGVDITDSRQINSAYKLELIELPNYHGIIFGSGTCSEYLNAFETAKEICASKKMARSGTLDVLIKKLTRELCEHVKMREEQVIERAHYHILAEEKNIPPKERAEYKTKRMKDVSQRVQDDREEDAPSLVIAGYDALKKKIRLIDINHEIAREGLETELVIGHGSDGASAYFAISGQRINSYKLTLPELLFRTALAYNFSMIKFGVEGTPYISVIDKNKVQILQPEESAILTNTAAAILVYLISPDKTIKYCEDIEQALLQKNQRKKIIAKIISDFKETTKIDIDISQTSIKTNAWGEIATRKYFKSQS